MGLLSLSRTIDAEVLDAGGLVALFVGAGSDSITAHLDEVPNLFVEGAVVHLTIQVEGSRYAAVCRVLDDAVAFSPGSRVTLEVLRAQPADMSGIEPFDIAPPSWADDVLRPPERRGADDAALTIRPAMQPAMQPAMPSAARTPPPRRRRAERPASDGDAPMSLHSALSGLFSEEGPRASALPPPFVAPASLSLAAPVAIGADDDDDDEPTGVVGTLKEMPVHEIVQTLAHSRKDAVVEVKPKRRAGGILAMERGRVVYASSGPLFGEPAFFELLGARRGAFRIRYGRTLADGVLGAGTEPNIAKDTTYLLLEGARLIDESGRTEADDNTPPGGVRRSPSSMESTSTSSLEGAPGNTPREPRSPHRLRLDSEPSMEEPMLHAVSAAQLEAFRVESFSGTRDELFEPRDTLDTLSAPAEVSLPSQAMQPLPPAELGPPADAPGDTPEVTTPDASLPASLSASLPGAGPASLPLGAAEDDDSMWQVPTTGSGLFARFFDEAGVQTPAPLPVEAMRFTSLHVQSVVEDYDADAPASDLNTTRERKARQSSQPSSP